MLGINPLFCLAQYGISIKKARTEEEYFNSDEEEEAPAYQPKEGSPGPGNKEADPTLYITIN